MISKLMGSALLLHGLEAARVSDLEAQILLLAGAFLIIRGIRLKEARLSRGR
ncbi:hypothetical protein [Methylocystis echinoides]|jgi:hypothetical protein|uniref:hypothetical protein n=1 Tax=Methylocystis echinoides TaxID=29468 RepID=UPI00344969BE